MGRKYYEAYDDRYQQVHQKSLTWFSHNSSAIVGETIRKYKIAKDSAILEIGCGEGRDAIPLLENVYRLSATDVSHTVIAYCKTAYPRYRSAFQVLDCLSQSTGKTYSFIYAVAVLHMLVPEEDRRSFYQFLLRHLTESGVALLCSIGDGQRENETDITKAFDCSIRTHDVSGKEISIANISCKTVSFSTLKGEIEANNLILLDLGITSIEPDFATMQYAVVRRR